MISKFITGIFIFITINSFSQVRLQTGGVSYNVPIYNYTNSKDGLSYNLALDYIGGNGIKVTDVSSDAGIGWELNSTAKIIRIKNEDADDQILKEDNQSSMHITSGILNNTVNQYGDWSGDINKVKWTPTYPDEGSIYFDHNVHRDRERDIFLLLFNGRSIRFVIGSDKTILPLDDCKIVFHSIEEANMESSGIISRIKSFSFTDENGLYYRFENTVHSEVFPYKQANTSSQIESNGFSEQYQYTGYTTFIPFESPNRINLMRGYSRGLYSTDEWHIREIRNPKNNKAITFNYSGFLQCERRMGFDANLSFTSENQTNSGVTREILGITENINRQKYSVLNSIDFPTGERIQFQYGEQRKDFNGRSIIRKLFLNQNSSTLFEIVFAHFYTYNGVITDEANIPSNAIKDDVCLFLKSITRRGVQGIDPLVTSFEYFLNTTTQKLPRRFTLARDIYDYPNGNTTQIGDNNTIDFYALRNFLNFSFPSPPQAMTFPLLPNTSNINLLSAGLIKKIVMPEKGSLEYEFESNTISVVGGGAFGGVRVKKVFSKPDQNSISSGKEYLYTKFSGYEWDLPSYTETYEHKTITPADGGWFGNNYNNYSAGRKVFSMGRTLGSTARLVNNSLINTPLNQGIGITASNIGMAYLSHFYALYQVVQTYAAIMGIPLNGVAYEEHNAGIKTNFLNPPYKTNRGQAYYTEVTEQSTTLANGKTVYEFTDNSSSPFQHPNGHVITSPSPFPYASRPRVASWAIGLPKKTTIYNTSGQIVKSSEYAYNIVHRNVTNASFSSIKVAVSYSLSSPIDLPFTDYSGSVPTYGLVSYYYGYDCGRAELKSKTEREYVGGTISATVFSEYEYHANNLMLKNVKTSNSKGEQIETKTYYPEDYTLSGVLQEMKASNVIKPVTTETWITQGGIKKMLSTTVNEYSSFGYKVINTYSLKSNTPIAFSSQDINPAVLIRDPNLIKIDNTITYDSDGNVTQIESSNRVNSTLYGHNKMLVIANITNSKYFHVAFTSFEPDATGNWVFPSSNITKEEGFKTGEYSFKLIPNVNTITSSVYMTAGKKYLLSFWVKGSKPSFSGKTPWNASSTITENLILKRTVNGWNYYEGSIQSNLTSNIIISGNGSANSFMDELRFRPIEARMITYTYRPGVGKTSETFENGISVYYQYDDLGRLSIIRDENWNIVKAYQYNFKQ